jgi:hypothetical protein
MVIKVISRSQKKGWIRIFEAVVAIFLIAIVVLIIVSSGAIKNGKFSVEAYNAEVFILRGVELNNTLRQEITDTGASEIVYWDSGFPINTKNQIINKTPSWLNCISNICPPGDSCLLTESQRESLGNTNIFSEAILIFTSTNPDTYNPRQLKLFCSLE